MGISCLMFDDIDGTGEDLVRAEDCCIDLVKKFVLNSKRNLDDWAS